MQRALLGIDGNCGFALLGPDIQAGEAEFVEIVFRPDESESQARRRAAWKAYQRLKRRVDDDDDLFRRFGEFSHEMGPGLAV